IRFSEEVSALWVNNGTFHVAGYDIDGFPWVSGDTVTISLREGLGPDTCATPAVTLIGSVQDNQGNELSGPLLPATPAADGAAPVMISAVTRSVNTIEITYSETVMNNNAAPTQYVFDIDGPGGTGPAVTNAVAVSVKRVTLTLTANVLSTGAPLSAATITYTEHTTAANRTRDTATDRNDAHSPQTLRGIGSGF
ncbi:MAG TPA: hypothetical protein VLH18_08080, partial [Candidatus Limnocylindrales bacterium]|nr:hypothetical protein [Candidatus Limnocylindrales bacterium]